MDKPSNLDSKNILLNLQYLLFQFQVNYQFAHQDLLIVSIPFSSLINKLHLTFFLSNYLSRHFNNNALKRPKQPYWENNLNSLIPSLPKLTMNEFKNKIWFWNFGLITEGYFIILIKHFETLIFFGLKFKSFDIVWAKIMNCKAMTLFCLSLLGILILRSDYLYRLRWLQTYIPFEHHKA